MEQQKNIVKIVILGGGFGGVYTARHLANFFTKDEVEITIINKLNYFLFTPLLHEVATGGLTPDSIIEPLREIFRGTPVNVVEDTILEIQDKEKKVLTTSNSYSYDYLVVGTGAETNFFATEGAKEHSFTLKTLQDAVSLRNHLIETCEKAVQTKNKDLLVTAVIGAGPSGVELAAEILEYMQHTLCSYYKNSGFVKEDIQVNLITTTADVISQFPQKMRDIAMEELKKKGMKILTNTIVTKVEPHLITFKDGTHLNAHSIVWVAGVTPSINGIKGSAESVSFALNRRIEVNSYLQSTKNPEIFALGDVSGTHPMLAQVAVQQAKTVAGNIYSLIQNKRDTSAENTITLSEFSFLQKGLLVSIGQWYAIGNFFGITFSGKIMWWIWRTVYLFNFLSWRKRFEIIHEWTTNLFYPRDISFLK